MIAREKLYYTALEYLGYDASPKDLAPDSLSCAESVNTLCFRALGHVAGGGTSTARMFAEIENNPHFIRVSEPEAGCIILSPTGHGDGRISNGHVGIVGRHRIMSNNSNTGRWDQYFTLESWREYFSERGGYPVYFYKPIS